MIWARTGTGIRSAATTMNLLCHSFGNGMRQGERFRRRCRVSSLGRGQFPGAPDHCRLSATARGGLRRCLQASGRDRPRSGVVQLGALAVDGSKVKANASKHKAMSYGRMRDDERRLREQIAASRTANGSRPRPSTRPKTRRMAAPRSGAMSCRPNCGGASNDSPRFAGARRRGQSRRDGRRQRSEEGPRA